MRLHSAVLVTRHLEQLRDFYTTTLGLHIVEDFGGCIVLDCGLSIWQPSDEHPVQPNRAMSGKPRDIGFPFELCFEADTVEEFDAIAEALNQSHVSQLHGVRTEHWGQRTIRVEDPDGNLIEWGESVPCFVRRLYRGCNSVVEVAKTTGIDVTKVEYLVDSTENATSRTEP